MKFPIITEEEIEMDRKHYLDDSRWLDKALEFAKINELDPVYICHSKRTKRAGPSNRLDTIFSVLELIQKNVLSGYSWIDHQEYYEKKINNQAVAVVHIYGYVPDDELQKMPSDIGVIHRAPMSWYYPKAATCYVFEFSDAFCKECLSYGEFAPVARFYSFINTTMGSHYWIKRKPVIQHLIGCCKYGILSADELFEIVNRGSNLPLSCLA